MKLFIFKHYEIGIDWSHKQARHIGLQRFYWDDDMYTFGFWLFHFYACDEYWRE